MLSAELKISYSSLQWGIIEGDKERIKRAGQVLGKLPLWLSELSLASAQWSDFEASKGQILLIDDFPFETAGKSEEFLLNLKRIALQKGKIILINAMLDEKLCRYPDIYANLRPFGLLGSVCDFVGLLRWCTTGANSIVEVTDDIGEMKIIEHKEDFHLWNRLSYVCYTMCVCRVLMLFSYTNSMWWILGMRLSMAYEGRWLIRRQYGYCSKFGIKL